MNAIIEALKRAVEEAEAHGHRTILFPVDDAKRLVEQWKNFPGKCLYQDKEWNILSIDMQAGELTLHNWKDGQLDNVDAEKCDLL